jgi:hypothetical protein
VKKCLFAWSDWSIFPASFTEGLEAIFYLSEGEVKNMEEFISTQVTEQEKHISSGDSSQEQQQLTMVESLKKKAKNSGVFLPRYEYASPFSSSERERRDYWEMRYKLDFIERYFQRNRDPEQSLRQQTTIPPPQQQTKTETTAEKEREREDIDLEGEPLQPLNEEEMDIDGEPMTMTMNRNSNEDNYDDIDGEPITEDNHQKNEAQQQEYDDDLDGIPMEEPVNMTTMSNNEGSNPREEQTGEEEGDLDGMPL